MGELLFNIQDASQQTLTLGYQILTILIAFALGGVICGAYIITGKKGQYSQNFMITLIMIPAIISIIILLVGNNIARAFSLAGTFSIIRFRSAPGNPRDITYIFFGLAAGLGCGVGLLGYAVIYVILLCMFLYVLHLFNFGISKTQKLILKITIPEDLDYQGVFDEILHKFTSDFELARVRTVDLGSLFQLVYVISLDNKVNEKEFIDELRCRNGNLSISITHSPAMDDQVKSM